MICLLLAACQHQHGPTIAYDQLMMYATQKENLPLWSSKARLQSLGGVIPPPSSARPLFGYKFAEAKMKVRILDIRDAEEFQKKNLAMDNDIASPVINIPKEALLTTRDLETLLKSNNIEKSSILLIVSSDTKDAKKVADQLQQNQYGQVLYYENDYN